jgi:hypothetical protein
MAKIVLDMSMSPDGFISGPITCTTASADERNDA